MTGVRDYSPTAASNLSVGGISIAEGMPRASVNNSIRAQLADTANLLLDMGGATTTTGSATAYLLALDSAPSAYADNLFFLATSHITNSGSATINLNGIGVVPIEKIVEGVNVPLETADFRAGHMGIFTYSSSNSSVLLLNPATTGLVSNTMAFYGTQVAAAASNISSTVATVETNGYATAGDGGGAQYVRRGAVEPAYPGKFQSADGDWWEIVADEFNVRAFGATGDGVTDDRDAIQDAIDRAIGLDALGVGHHKVLLSPGRYVISAPLHCFQRDAATNAYAYSTVIIGCEAPGYVSAKRTVLLPTFNDLPAIFVQAARYTRISGFSIEGNASTTGPQTGGVVDFGKLLNDDVGTPWWNTLGARDNGYSPHAGIVIDAFHGSLPPYNADPLLSDRYPGYDAYYDGYVGGQSRGVTIEYMEIQGFIVGVGISMSGLALGDHMTVQHCNLSRNKVCISQGQTQNRGNLFHNNLAIWFQVYVDCTRYGIGASPLGTITGGVLSTGKWIILGNPGGESGTIRDVYAEAMWSIGHWGYTAGGHSLLVERCHIKFILGWANSPPTATIDAHLHNNAPVAFIGGHIGFNNNVVYRMSMRNTAPVLFDGNIELDGTPQCATEDLVEFKSVRVRFAQSGPTYGISREYNTILATLGAGPDAKAPPGCIINDGARRWRSISGWRVVLVDGGPLTITVVGDGTATFTTSVANAAKLVIGDYLTTLTAWTGENPSGGVGVSYAKTTIGRVTAVNSGTGAVALIDVPKSFLTASYSNIYMWELPKIHQITIGTTTASSTSVTGVTPPTGWLVGDHIQGTGIPSGCRIAAIATIAGPPITLTLTLSIAATASGTVELYDAQLVMEEGSAAAIPTTGTWGRGTFMRNSTPSKDGSNMVLRGWVCTLSGSPGTWEPQYTSAVSPAT